MRATRSQQRLGRQAFTLIELMVVILIIGLLASVLLFSISGVFGESEEREAENTIQLLKIGVQKWTANNSVTEPPGSIQELAMLFGGAAVDPNQTNIGIEALVLALRDTSNAGPFISNDLLSNRKSNVDIDELGQPIESMVVDGELKLFEILDPWDRPFICVTETQLINQTPISVQFTEGGPITIVDLMALQNEVKDLETGTSVTDDRFYIWSVGPDGVNNNGSGDDIVSWRK